MANIPATRTDDQTLRALQWARLRDLTAELLTVQDSVYALRLAIRAAQVTLTWEWQFSDCDLEVVRILKKRITSRVDALKLATDDLSSIQSELLDLQTALDDNYERQE